MAAMKLGATPFCGEFFQPFRFLWSPSVPAGIPIWLKKKEEGNASSGQHYGAVPSGIPENGAANLLDDGLRLCGVLRDAAAFCANYSRWPRSQKFGARRAAKKVVSFLQGARNWEVYSAAS